MKKLRIWLNVLVVLVLSIAAVPIQWASSSNQPPIINLLSINGQNAPTVYADIGQVSYALIVSSYSANQKALVTLTVENTETNELTTIFKDQWLENKSNTGTMELQKGSYLVTLYAVDEIGQAAEPYSVTVIVGADTDLAIRSADPNPILIKEDKETKNVTVTLSNNTPSSKTTTVGWRWEGESVLRDEQSVTLPGMYQNLGKVTITFPISLDMQEQTKRTIEFVLNPDHDPLEQNYDNNHIAVPVQYDFPDLSIDGPRLVSFTEDEMTIEYSFEQLDLPGRTETLVTSLEYGIGEAQRIGVHTGILLAVGERKTFTVTMPRNEATYGHINPQGNAPAQENEWKNNYKESKFDFSSRLNLYVKSVKGGVYRKGENVTTIVQVGNIPDSVMPEAVDLVLRFDGKEVGRQSVHLNPGEEREVPFEWKTPVTGKSERATYKLEAEIHPKPRKFDEITYEDNIRSANVVLLPEEVVGAVCRKEENQTTAVSGTYEYYCNCTPVGCSICIGKYYESIVVTPEYQTATVKAGMGFAYKLKTEYHNSNPHNGRKHDFSRIMAEFDSEEHQGDTVILPAVELVPQNPPPESSNIWQFPRAKIERGQKDIEAIEYVYTLDPLAVDESQHVDGQNKYYTSFYQKDGTYPFAVKGEGAGVTFTTHTDIEGNTTATPVSPRLSTCIDEQYNILGSPHDDYIYRRVDPNNPYPHNIQPGWDWKGYEWYFDELAPWYNSNGKDDSSGLDVTEFSVYPQEAGR
ncbi:hypothetical protein [Brevibacillus brevis]|uniref:CARDB domain-containing protein n=1 Tax=Brevibacillus brevis TaxID=1393 RepID=A0ABY9T683_BREBE|nr:hypothetical protein [Brevibacillus brevis]WNC15409.1 hypothetical protein RGB73_03380 [Brevibacillus brevis]